MFGIRLRRLREARGMTQQELATILNKTPKAVGLYESDQRQPKFEDLITLSSFFGVTTDYLLGVKIEESPPATNEADSRLSMITEVLKLFSDSELDEINLFIDFLISKREGN